MNEGHGLGETVETAMVVGEESWTRFGVALFWDASEPALNTGTGLEPCFHVLATNGDNEINLGHAGIHVSDVLHSPDIQHCIAYELGHSFFSYNQTLLQYSNRKETGAVLACDKAVCTNLGKGRRTANSGD